MVYSTLSGPTKSRQSNLGITSVLSFLLALGFAQAVTACDDINPVVPVGAPNDYSVGLAFKRVDNSIEWATTDLGPTQHRFDLVDETAGINRYGSPATSAGPATIRITEEGFPQRGVYALTFTALSPDGRPEQFIHDNFDAKGFTTALLHIGTGLGGFDPIVPGCTFETLSGHVYLYYSDLEIPYQDFELGSWETSAAVHLSTEIDFSTIMSVDGVGIRKVTVTWQFICDDEELNPRISSSIYDGSGSWSLNQGVK